MTLGELVRLLDQHGVNLALTAEGKLKPTADQQPPAEVIEGIRAHRAALVRRLERGQRADGRLDVARLSALPGHCGSCARWEEAPDWGPLMGVCGCPPAAWPGGLPPLAIHAGHRCAAYREEGEEVGRGYRAKGQAPAPRPRPRQVTL